MKDFLISIAGGAIGGILLVGAIILWDEISTRIDAKRTGKTWGL